MKWVKCPWDHNFLWPRGKLSIIAVDRDFFFSRKDTVEGLDEKFKDGRGHFQGTELDPNGEIFFFSNGTWLTGFQNG